MDIEYLKSELKDLAANLRVSLEAYLSDPTGKGYHSLRNKIAEYYSVSQARREQYYEADQARMRQELGIGETQ